MVTIRIGTNVSTFVYWRSYYTVTEVLNVCGWGLCFLHNHINIDLGLAAFDGDFVLSKRLDLVTQD